MVPIYTIKPSIRHQLWKRLQHFKLPSFRRRPTNTNGLVPWSAPRHSAALISMETVDLGIGPLRNGWPSMRAHPTFWWLSALKSTWMPIVKCPMPEHICRQIYGPAWRPVCAWWCNRCRTTIECSLEAFATSRILFRAPAEWSKHRK